MGAIFLSYARTDRACAEALARALEGAGHQVWWDRRLESGSEFAAEIEAALSAADLVLVVWSRNSIKSRWVRDEAAIGGDTGRLVPTVIDGSQPPIGFRQFQAFDLNGWKGARKDARIAELLAAIERRLGRKEGDEFVPPASAAERRSVGPARRKAWVIAAALTLLVAAGAILLFLNNREKSGGASKPTIAIAPITAATSADAGLRDLAARTRESISHTFTQSGVTVKLLASAPQGGRPPGDYVLSGELSRNGDKVVASIRLDETTQGVTLLSKRFEAAADDVPNLPERVGAQMAGNLGWAAPLMTLSRRHTTDPAITADLLQSNDFTGDNLQAYQIIRRVAADAPDTAMAQVSLAFGTAMVLDQLPRQERAAAVAAALRAADLALQLAPEFGDTYGAWCLLHSETRMTECEDRLRAGKRVDPDAPFLDTFLGNLLRGVGRYDEAVELTRLSYAHDPYVPTKIGWMLRALEYDGESREADELYRKSLRWWPEFLPNFFWNRLVGRLDRGDFDAVFQLEKDVGSKGLPPDYRSSRDLVAALRSQSRAGISRICAGAEQFNLIVRCLAAYARVDDLDSAYTMAADMYPPRVGRSPAETEKIWLNDPSGVAMLSLITTPSAAALRRDPRYLDLARRVGLLAYWRSGRPPDFCRKQPEPVCAQLMKRR